MKQSYEKHKMVTETIDIDMLVNDSTVLNAKKDGDGMKEPYETPKMVTKTIDGSNGDRLEDLLEELNQSSER